MPFTDHLAKLDLLARPASCRWSLAARLSPRSEEPARSPCHPVKTGC